LLSQHAPRTSFFPPNFASSITLISNFIPRPVIGSFPLSFPTLRCDFFPSNWTQVRSTKFLIPPSPISIHLIPPFAGNRLPPDFLVKHFPGLTIFSYFLHPLLHFSQRPPPTSNPFVTPTIVFFFFFYTLVTVIFDPLLIFFFSWGFCANFCPFV